MIGRIEFERNCDEFSKTESRASFYEFANKIITEHPIHACVIILAVWNKGNFNFVQNREEFLHNFISSYKRCYPLIEKLNTSGYEFCNVNFDEIREPVKRIYDIFSNVEGVKYTGASKVMHLLSPKLFVMWDSYINGTASPKGGIKKYYKELGLRYKRYNTNSDGYIEFLKDMQIKYCNIQGDYKGRTFAKCIDENNYITITKKIQDLERKYKKRKK